MTFPPLTSKKPHSAISINTVAKPSTSLNFQPRLQISYVPSSCTPSPPPATHGCWPHGPSSLHKRATTCRHWRRFKTSSTKSSRVHRGDTPEGIPLLQSAFLSHTTDVKQDKQDVSLRSTVSKEKRDLISHSATWSTLLTARPLLVALTRSTLLRTSTATGNLTRLITSGSYYDTSLLELIFCQNRKGKSLELPA